MSKDKKKGRISRIRNNLKYENNDPLWKKLFYIKENFENTRGIRIYTSKDIPRNIDALNERFYEISREFVLDHMLKTQGISFQKMQTIRNNIEEIFNNIDENF